MYDDFPWLTKHNYHYFTFIAFYTSIIMFLFAPTQWLYYYFPIQTLVTFTGLGQATNVWNPKLFRLRHMWRYIFPFVLILSRSHTFLKSYDLDFFLWMGLGIVLYSWLLLIITKNKSLVSIYNTSGFHHCLGITVGISIGFFLLRDIILRIYTSEYMTLKD